MPYPDDPGLRAATRDLLAQSWTKLPAAIDRAARWGADWCELSTPFVEREGDRVVAHVGVIELPLVIEGREQVYAGIHAVCTAGDRRRRGLMRATMARALAWADQRYAGALLWANDPALYQPFGFVEREESIFVGEVRGGPSRARALDLERPDELAFVRERLERRVPVSRRSGARGPAAALELLDLSLWRSGPELAHLPELECLVVYAVRERFLDLYDVIAEHEPPLAEIAARLGERIDTAVVYFTPDRLAAPWLRAEPTSLLDTLMTRGPWPSELEALAIPPLTRC